MRRVFGRMLGAVLAMLMFAGCGAGNGNAGKSETKEKTYKIGVTQIGDHPSLDNCREGFIDGLKSKGFEEGKNIEIDFQSARGDMAVANQIAENFAASGKDIVCGIATPSAQALYTKCYDKGIPVIFNAISDPVEAKLAKSETEAMDGITGISDALPVEEQLKLIRKVLPEAKNIGILYTTSEANSVSTIKKYKDLAPKYGFEIVDKGIGNQAEIPQATDILLEKVDCISNMTDNTVVEVLSLILEKANAKNIPVFGSEEEQVKNGCIASAGLDYFKLGQKAGIQAARVLSGEDVSTIPYETLTEAQITVNEEVAEKLGITIPDDIKSLS